MNSDSDSPDPLSSPDSPPPQTPPNLHQNTIDPDARWLVQKYGGTSVGKFAVKIACDIVSSVSQFSHHVAPIYQPCSLVETTLIAKRSQSCARLDLVPQKLWEPPTSCSKRLLRRSKDPQWGRVGHPVTKTGLHHYIPQMRVPGPVLRHARPYRTVGCPHL